MIISDVPSEVLIPEHASGQPHEIGRKIESLGIRAITVRPGWQFTLHHASQELRRQWQLAATGGIGFDEDDPAIVAIGAVLSYLAETQKTGLSHLRLPRKHVVEEHLSIDPASFRSLEIDRTVRTGGTEGSLLSAIDRTQTAMGARLLRQWLRYPLCDIEHIRARHSAVAAMLESPPTLRQIVSRLNEVCDIERIVARLTVGRASPRDLAALGRCLAGMPGFIDTLQSLPNAAAVAPELASSRAFCIEQAQCIARAIMPDPPPHLREGGVIADGFDRLRSIASNSQQWLASYQAKLASQTNIPSLKVGYNKVFGYYIEVTDAHRQKIPPAWTRKQTIKNAERYITPELKEFETEALGARDRAIALEQQLFEKVRQTLLPHVPAFQELAAAIARVDVLGCFASLALERRYCCPQVVEDRVLQIVDGRHPVLEQQLGSEFVANDVHMGPEDSLLLITGPNMAGKSTVRWR